MIICLKILLFISCVLFTNVVSGYKSYEDKLVLSPVELVDMVIQERMKTHVQGARLATIIVADPSTTDNAATESELNDDENTLKRHKVWSRWGKWGECSVTCGSGVVRRQRVCAGGRCARGELEEQRRPCSGAPCSTLALRLDPRDTD